METLLNYFENPLYPIIGGVLIIAGYFMVKGTTNTSHNWFDGWYTGKSSHSKEAKAARNMLRMFGFSIMVAGVGIFMTPLFAGVSPFPSREEAQEAEISSQQPKGVERSCINGREDYGNYGLSLGIYGGKRQAAEVVEQLEALGVYKPRARMITCRSGGQYIILLDRNCRSTDSIQKKLTENQTKLQGTDFAEALYILELQ